MMETDFMIGSMEGIGDSEGEILRNKWRVNCLKATIGERLTFENAISGHALHSESQNWAKRLTDRIIVNWIELRLAKLDFYSICVLDDIVDEDVWGSSYRLLKTHTETVLFWDDKDKLKEVLAL